MAVGAGVRGTGDTRGQLPVCVFRSNHSLAWHHRGDAIPSSGELPDPRIEPGSPALLVDSLPAELPGKKFSLLSTFPGVPKVESFQFNIFKKQMLFSYSWLNVVRESGSVACFVFRF